MTNTTVKLSKMETVAYAMPNAALSDLLAQMRKLEGAEVKREGTTATGLRARQHG